MCGLREKEDPAMPSRPKEARLENEGPPRPSRPNEAPPLVKEAPRRIWGMDPRDSSFENDIRFENESRGAALGWRKERMRRAGGTGSPDRGM